MNFDSGVRLHVVGQTVSLAIEHGREWGQLFLNDISWKGDKKKMAKHAISESVFFSLRKGISNGLPVMPEVPSEAVVSLYSQVKLASTLFTIYEIDTIRTTAQPLVLAAAAGITLGELASQLGIQTVENNIQKALLSVPSKKFTEINKSLGTKLMFKTGEKNIVSESAMNACGFKVKAFIKLLRE